MRILLPVIMLLCSSYLAHAQTYRLEKTNWQDAGYQGAKPVFSRVVDLLQYGADPTGTLSSNTALTNAVSALNGQAGVILFPAGTYYFDAAVNINRDSIVFRGAGHDSTLLRFDLGRQVQNLITIEGSLSTTDSALLTSSGIKNALSVAVSNATAFRPGDWVVLNMNDQAFMTSSWAYGSLSQTMQVQSVSGNNITFSSPLRFNYAATNRPVIRKIIPRQQVGFECLKLQRLDATAGQSSNLVFDRAVNCWVNGIESDTTNFAHIEINRSAHIDVTNSYLHHAFAFGGNGQAYGVLLQFGSNECKVEANYFKRLRHSMLLQAGANGNVLGYNYSVDPFWTEPSLPDSSAGDIVLHGNWAFMNLAEGNFIRNIVIDDSHGKNGPFNTFLRNRADGFGIFMNFNPPTDSVQFVGNEITNTLIGLNFLQGAGHFTYGNNYRGTITSGSAAIPDTSLYLLPGQRPPCPGSYDAWPVVGRPGGYNTGTIYAKARVIAGQTAACSCPLPGSSHIRNNSLSMEWVVYPNPADEQIELRLTSGRADRVEIHSMDGRLLHTYQQPAATLDIRHLSPGIYLVRVLSGSEVGTKRFIKR